MIRLTWLQFRTQAVTAAAALAAFAVLLAVTGPHLASLYNTSGLVGCHGGGCGNLAGSFEAEVQGAGIYSALYVTGLGIILLTPAVIGLFWGAPLIARELETGTAALAWNQSVTRTRWLAVKLTIVGLTAMAVAEGLSLMQAWWAAPLGRAASHGAPSGPLTQGRFTQLIFASHGITPLGYAAFAFALGVTAGSLVRRTIPAMAATLAIFAALQIAMPLWIRPNLFPASHTTVPIAFGNSTLNLYSAGSPHAFTSSLAADDGLAGQPEAWIRSSGAADAAGHPVSSAVPSACVPAAISSGPGAALANCLSSRGIRIAVVYQPASRYWPLQWTETGIYLVLSLALAGYCFRRLRCLS